MKLSHLLLGIKRCSCAFTLCVLLSTNTNHMKSTGEALERRRLFQYFLTCLCDRTHIGLRKSQQNVRIRKVNTTHLEEGATFVTEEAEGRLGVGTIAVAQVRPAVAGEELRPRHDADRRGRRCSQNKQQLR